MYKQIKKKRKTWKLYLYKHFNTNRYLFWRLIKLQHCVLLYYVSPTDVLLNVSSMIAEVPDITKEVVYHHHLYWTWLIEIEVFM